MYYYLYKNHTTEGNEHLHRLQADTLPIAKEEAEKLLLQENLTQAIILVTLVTIDVELKGKQHGHLT